MVSYLDVGCAAGISSYVFAVFPVLTGQRGIGNRNPMLFVLKIPYAAPLLAGLLANPFAGGDGGLRGR